MGVAPHALHSRLLQDLADQFPSSTLDRIKSGDSLWPGISFKEQAAASIVSSLTKKWEASMTEETKAKALRKFLQVNESCKNWRLEPDCYEPCDDFLLGELRSYLWKFWTRAHGNPLVDHDYDVLARGQHGPGSAIGSIGGDFYTKLFSSRMATTDPNLYFWYRRYIRGFAEWNNAELTRILEHGDPEIVTGNRLDFVPKNDEVSRSICVEPSLNMFYQLGFASILNSRLKDLWGIDLEIQQFKNRELARKGSWDESYVTIDLASASDSISLSMLKWLLPPDFYSRLVKYRSKSSRLPNGKSVELHMISTMGNGYTFPLQTIIFTGIVLSAFRLSGLAPVFPRGVSEGNFGVNGDDIVVPSIIHRKVLRLLHLLGFTTNKEKTFVEGPFRESCGGDYFLGRNLRGVYIRKLNAPQDFYSAINQLNLFSTRTGIRLHKLVKYLLARVRYLPVPVWENDDAGIKVPFSLVSGRMRICRDTQSTKYYAWTPRPGPMIRIGERELYTPRGFKRRYFNLSGLFLSILQGSVNPNGIPLLPKKVYYRTKARVAPNWDTPLWSDMRAVQLFAGWFVFSRWESCVYANLYG
jgi:hypothetical protein